MVSQSPIDAHSPSKTRSYLAARKDLGRLIQQGKSWSGRERNSSFLNIGASRFLDISSTTGLNLIDDGRAVALADWDFDGDVDVWLTNRTAPRIRFMRNDSATGHHYLGVRLRGRSCNRDAIGTRLEVFLDEPPRRIIKTLRAGDGFLAQSSKWIHFGLAGATRIRRLVLRWPDGRIETVEGLEPDHFYEITQGSGEARRWEPPTVPRRPPDRGAKAPLPASRRIVLSAPVPAPSLRYEDLTGQPAVVGAGRGGAVLVNLWATWCLPCRKELGEFARRRRDLEAAGLRVVALSVDGLGKEPHAGPRRIRAFLNELNFPFRVGLATQRIMDKLDLLQKSILSKPWPFPLPTSFLIDSRGVLAAVYKGPVSVEDLLRDLSVLEAKSRDRRGGILPFPGRRYKWGWPRVLDYMDSLARAYAEGGYPEEALELYRSVVRLNPSAEAHLRLASALDREGDSRAAIAEYEETIRLDPDNLRAHNDLALALARSGDDEQAILHYRRTVDLDPTSMVARINLGLALRRKGRTADAGRHLSEAVRLQPDNLPAARKLAWMLLVDQAPAIRNVEAGLALATRLCVRTDYSDPRDLDLLAAAFAESGRFAEAIETGRTSLRLARERGDRQLAGRIAAHLRLYDGRRSLREGSSPPRE
ncbi:MAG: tetratricopeptide repeat protein [Acidobacteriota bacterium]